MRFLVDMPLSPALARWLVDEGHDAVHAFDLGLASAEDSAIIDRARRDQRTIVTADLDYPRLLALSAAAEPSLILFRGGDWSEQAVTDRLREVLATVATEGLDRCILVIDRGRVRRRSLPVAPRE
jgi:predicted nuclease of predicted toxin-antitoxin system